MLQIESQKNCDSIEIFLDENGVDDLIRYLSNIKRNIETFHLTVGNELDETELFNMANYKLVKHVKLVYLPALDYCTE